MTHFHDCLENGCMDFEDREAHTFSEIIIKDSYVYFITQFGNEKIKFVVKINNERLHYIYCR